MPDYEEGPLAERPMISRRVFLTLTGGAMVMAYARSSTAVVPVVPPMLDHILLGCSDLDQGIAFVEQATGVRPAIGGVHPGRGTLNALISLGKLHYLEVIAPDPAQASMAAGAPSLLCTLRRLDAPRIVAWAAHTTDIKTLAAKLRKAGIAFEGPNPGSRKRPDGQMLHWQTLNLNDDENGMLPFFIQWGAGSIHPSVDAPAGCELESLGATTADPHTLLAAYQQLGLAVDVERGAKSALQAQITGSRGKLDLSS